ncbi:hypothetical protein [Hydrogenophilus thermoluteolus]|uniref:Uncharacterized protein n=1 Tax=Hydrogenophilus thermoluteolus TaxID=297 RepID=A0A2Z6DXN2_HYDTE|nr:hypothetical protein [Hydrogenophilus thermoluteolus]BBD77223.1 hypothetical protein HPTL_0956 [Hydrogenophilus thermoluteolus]
MIQGFSVLAAALVCVGAGFASGYAFKGRLDEGRIARAEAAVVQCQRDREADARHAAEEAARRLAAAQEAERAAVHALQATKARLAATEKRLKESLYALPTAQSCGLSGAARGLLNARIAASDLPAGAAEFDRAHTESAADSGSRAGVDEAALGGWIADAISAYDACRARIDAIRAWDEVTHGR